MTRAIDSNTMTTEQTPALRPMSEAGLSEADRFAALIKGWSAVCPVTGAFLSASHGRTKRGDTKYVLILPTETPAERGGLFAKYEWNDEDRKFIRAYSEAEAIEIANKRLEKMLKVRGQTK